MEIISFETRPTIKSIILNAVELQICRSLYEHPSITMNYLKLDFRDSAIDYIFSYN